MTQGLLSESILSWAAEAAAATIVAVEPLHARGPWRLRVDRGGRTCELVLRIPAPRWINADMVASNAAALQLAEEHGLAAPRLIARDLDGEVAGVAATVETALPGSSAFPTQLSAKRLREAGAAIAKVYAIPLAPQPNLPLRTKHTQSMITPSNAAGQPCARLVRTANAPRSSTPSLRRPMATPPKARARCSRALG